MAHTNTHELDARMNNFMIYGSPQLNVSIYFLLARMHNVYFNALLLLPYVALFNETQFPKKCKSRHMTHSQHACVT